MRKITLKLLAVAACFFALDLCVFQPSVAHAQRIGSHLGEGDYGAQLNNIEILKANGAEVGFPVTLMMNITTAARNESAMIDLANAVNDAGFFPIVRITHVCRQFESGVTPTQAVNNIRAAFGPEAIIVYGNEVNNQETECNDWPRYISEFNSIADKTNVSPAALDKYMGNPAYASDKFLESAAAQQIYASATVQAANAYGCVGQTAASCNSPFEPNTQLIGLSGYSGKIYLTEFSLSPGSRDNEAPDTDLNDVIQFIQEKALGTGAEIITPLVRNVCNSEGEWLLYVNGRLFTTAGTEVTNNCDPALAIRGFDLSRYPEYLVDPAYYLLHPIKGIHPLSDPGGQRVSVTRQDLAAQGYEAHCAAPDTTIKLDVNTQGIIDRFLQLYEGIRLDTISNYELDSSGGKVPIFRDTEGKRWLTASLEEYFGFEDFYIDNLPEQEVNTAPINSLLAQEQRCMQSVRLIAQTQKMCERLGAKDRCAPRGEQIPGTDYTVEKLIDELQLVMPDYYDPERQQQASSYYSGGEKIGCENLFANKLPGFPDGYPNIDNLKEAVLNTPLYINRSYRLAFLVAAIEQKPETNFFSFFSFSNNAQPKHEVLIVAFKIPDILTNKGGGEESGHTFFTDAASQTRNILVPRQFRISEDETNPGFERESRDTRTIIGENAANAAVQSPDSPIYCVTGGGDTPAELTGASGAAACKDVLGKAIIDLINGSTPNCSNVQTEPVREIMEAANIIPPELNDSSRVYDAGYHFGTDVFNYIFLSNQNPQQADTRGNPLKSIFDVVRGRWQNASAETSTVRFFLVMPMGYELESVTEVMKNTFFNQDQLEKLANAERATHFNSQGFRVNFDGGSASHTYQDTPDSGNCVEKREEIHYEIIDGDPVLLDPPRVVITYDCSKNFSIGVQEEGSGGVSFPGARLGYWLTNIQRGLHSYYSQAHAYLSSCSTTEDFLLGKCSGGIVSQPVSATGPGQNYGDGTCSPVPDGPCSVASLLPFFEQAKAANPNRLGDPKEEATKASIICNKESHGNASAANKRCLTSQSVDYSIGLFQINMLAHCPGALADDNGVVSGQPGYNAFDMPCSVADQAKLTSCENEMLNPQNNINKMTDLRIRRGNWKDWSAATVCGIEN